MSDHKRAFNCSCCFMHLLFTKFTAFFLVCREQVQIPKEFATAEDAQNNAANSSALTNTSQSQDTNIDTNGINKPNYGTHSLLKSASISTSKCIVEDKKRSEVCIYVCSI